MNNFKKLIENNSPEEIEEYIKEGKDFMKDLNKDVRTLEKLVKKDPIKNFEEIGSLLKNIEDTCEYIHDAFWEAKY